MTKHWLHTSPPQAVPPKLQSCWRKPYRRSDLNWMNKKSRNSVEMNNKSIRPEIAESNVQIAE